MNAEVGEVLRRVCAVFKVSEDKLSSRWRASSVVDARRAVALVLRYAYGLTCEDVGRAINRKHPAVINLCQTGRNYYRTEPHFRGRVERVAGKSIINLLPIRDRKYERVQDK